MNSDKNNSFHVTYPRRVFIRKSMITAGRLLFGLLADVEINGKEHLPQNGPMILAGNHVAALEAVMMAIYSPGMVEFIGNGDIPFDPNYAPIVKAYDLIPVNRGNLDRRGLKMGLDVLAQDGILGIFPEGGHWDPARMQAQIGVAWLSYKAGVPVIPIGFGGVKKGLSKALKLKHPKLVMNVGEMIPSVSLSDHNGSLKEGLTESARQILSAINNLVPEEDLRAYRRRMDEKYRLKIEVSSDDHLVSVPVDLEVEHGSAYAHFLFNPTLMDVLIRNLHLPLKPLKQIYHQSDLSEVIVAWESILNYLQENPGYFTYRFGVEEGLAVEMALKELIRLAKWIQKSGYSLTINPVRRYRNGNTGAQVTERGGCFPSSM